MTKDNVQSAESSRLRCLDNYVTRHPERRRPPGPLAEIDPENPVDDHNIKVVVRYDGYGFAGWQVQPGQRTIQSEIERAMEIIAGYPVKITGSGRTDSGVHALGQVFSCRVPRCIPNDRLRRSLSRMLHPEMRIDSVDDVDDSFDARWSACGKRYAYAISLASESDPFSRCFSWRQRPTFDVERMAELAQRFVGEHDFAGFQCSKAAPARTTIRRVRSITLHKGGFVGPCDAPGLYHFMFHGNGFLYKMVRNLVGTLVDVTSGVKPESWIEARLNAPGPYLGYTAPAWGLALIEVEYPEPEM
jgi:tRNA pseudouridine38-40 synthase